MISLSSDHNPNYVCKVVELDKFMLHPNADRLQLAIVDYQKMVVSIDAKPGDLYIYFPLECEIDAKFLHDTNSFASPVLNADKEAKGYFKSRRVKAVKFRGVMSEGYLFPVKVFNEWSGLDLGTEYAGREFDTVNGELFVKKYVPRQNHRQKVPKLAKPRKKPHTNDLFRLVRDTNHLKKNLHLINPNHIISIEYKLNGCAASFANLPKKRSLWKRLRDLSPDYEYICASRKVIKGTGHLGHYGHDVWLETLQRIKEKIQPNISIHGEIVGYLGPETFIQKGYDYGCAPGKNEFYVWRIFYMADNGDALEFSRAQVEEYCEQHGLKTVPLMYHGRAFTIAQSYSRFHENLLQSFESYIHDDCYMCQNKVPAEGIVVKIEGMNYLPLKLKSEAFVLRETKQLDTGEENIDE